MRVGLVYRASYKCHSEPFDQASGQDPTNVFPIDYTVIFSEAVTGFTGSDVSFADAYVKGVKGFNARDAYDAAPLRNFHGARAFSPPP